MLRKHDHRGWNALEHEEKHDPEVDVPRSLALLRKHLS
jgi:hypothetical protein